MFQHTESQLTQFIVHKVGNISREEGTGLSERPAQLDDSLFEVLMQYFLSSFKEESFYHFKLDEAGEGGQVFDMVTAIFEEPDSLPEHSQALAQHLYRQSLHPNIKAGELYVAYFSDMLVEDELTDAIGIFKSENKATFLQVFEQPGSIGVKAEKGININKLDKGCLIFNTEREMGYKLAIIDQSSKNQETARYWQHDFLAAKAREDDFYHTKGYIKMCKGFVEDVLQGEEKGDKTSQINLLNDSAKYFTEQATFDEADFEEKVMQEPEIIEAFRGYKEEYQQKNEVSFADAFDIAPEAVRKDKKYLRSVLKLDKNFHIYIHGAREYVEKGFDEAKGMHFYKFFFNEEE